MRLLGSLFIFLGIFAHAAEQQTCKELQALYQDDKMNQVEWSCGRDKECKDHQRALLKITAKMRDQKTDEESLKALEPNFYKVTAGDVEYDVVDIDLGGNPNQSFFYADTTKYAGIRRDDSSIVVGGKFCDVEFEAYIKDEHRRTFCIEIKRQVENEKEDSTYTVGACMSKKEGPGSTAPVFYVNNYNKRYVTLTASGSLENFGGGFYNCTGKVTRVTSKLSGKMRCTIN